MCFLHLCLGLDGLPLHHAPIADKQVSTTRGLHGLHDMTQAAAQAGRGGDSGQRTLYDPIYTGIPPTHTHTHTRHPTPIPECPRQGRLSSAHVGRQVSVISSGQVRRYQTRPSTLKGIGPGPQRYQLIVLRPSLLVTALAVSVKGRTNTPCRPHRRPSDRGCGGGSQVMCLSPTMILLQGPHHDSPPSP